MVEATLGMLALLAHAKFHQHFVALLLVAVVAAESHLQLPVLESSLSVLYFVPVTSRGSLANS
eukprot:2500172-Prorocentrum_lima.AAC.1